MLQSLILHGEKQRFTVAATNYPGEVITGIESPDGVRHMMLTGDPRYPRPHERTQSQTVLRLGEKATERLVGLFTRIFINGEAIDYDCTVFPLFVFGEITELRRGVFRDTHRIEKQVHPNDLEPSRPYGISDRDGDYVHAMIATDPLHSVSLLGRSLEGGGLMMRVANQHLMKIYNGEHIGEITRNGDRLSIDT